MKRSVLQKLSLACLPVAFGFSLFIISSAALADTNFIDPEIVAENPQVKQLNDALKKEGVKTDSLLDEQFLFASLIWGSVGGGYLIYARKQREIVPFVGGVAMIMVSYFIGSWFWMSLVCIGLMVGVWQLMKRGW